jgi:ribonuclease III
MKKHSEFVQWNLDEFLDFDEIVNNIDNYKSLLMEFSQAEKLNLPRYVVLSEEGPGHDKTFHVAVYIDDEKLGVGQGKSKKQAEQVAAKNALDLIMK